MSPSIAFRMLDGRTVCPRPNPPVLVAQGSIAHLAPPGAVLWGTGVNGKVPDSSRRLSSGLDIRAVRGPWTRRVLQAQGIVVPTVYGDPASLVSRLFPELQLIQAKGRIDALCVPNLHDVEWMREQAQADGLTLLHPQSPVATALEPIASARFVVGSSLHAVIVAEALGIPARFVVSREESAFKYLDYLAGTNRPHEPIAQSIAEAVATGGMAPPAGDLDALVEAFPWDLWGGRATSAPAATPREDDAGVWGWFSSWRNPSATRSSADQEYARVLERLAESYRQSRPESDVALARALSHRKWLAPSVPTAVLPTPELRSLDLALVHEDLAAADRILRQQAVGFTAKVYDVFRTPGGTLVALTIGTPIPSDPVVAVTLPNSEGPDLEVSTAGLTISPIQTRIDLDFVSGVAFDIDTSRTATITLRSGETHRVAVELLHTFPSFN
jgi:pyruvyltransferase